MAITPLTKKRIIYSDFGRDLIMHPVSGDVSRKTNEEAIKESIKNLVLTERGERPFQPDIGCNIRSLLFENFTEETLNLIRDMVTETIEAYEPRCILNGVDVTGRIDSNELTVIIVFTPINSETPATLEVVFNRIR